MTSQESEEIAQMVEDQVSKKVLNVLSPLFGSSNVRVSAKAKINMETLIRETINYNTPEKIDQNDKSGLLSKESGARESTQDGGTAGGVAGTETNSDVPVYGTDATEDDNVYSSQQYDREYLFDQIKEQGQVPAGAIEDLSVAVTVNGEDLGDIDEDDLKSVIGTAAGIALVDQDEKIAVLAAPYFEATEDETQTTAGTGLLAGRRGWVIGGLLVGFLVLVAIGVVLAVILSRNKKKKKAAEEAARREEEQMATLLDALGEEGAEIPAAAIAEGEEQEPEVLDAETERAMDLRQQIRDFAEQSPEIAAQMLRNWLNGGELGGRGDI